MMIRNRVQQVMRVNLLERNKNTGRLYRGRKQVYSRALYYGLCRELTSMSLEAIGNTLGQDHATALHAITKTYNNFMLWNETDYIKACELIKQDIDKNNRAKYVEDLIRQNILLKRENNELKKRAYVLPNRGDNNNANANI